MNFIVNNNILRQDVGHHKYRIKTDDNNYYSVMGVSEIYIYLYIYLMEMPNRS